MPQNPGAQVKTFSGFKKDFRTQTITVIGTLLVLLFNNRQ